MPGYGSVEIRIAGSWFFVFNPQSAISLGYGCPLLFIPEFDKPSPKFDGLVKNLLGRHPGESRGPEGVEITGFRLSPE
jgi:hypothetical protein